MDRHRWPSEDPIGKRITFDKGQHWITVAGVIGDAKEYGLARPMADEVYLPVAQAGFAANLVVRTAADPMTVSPAVRSVLHDLDPQLPFHQLTTFKPLPPEPITSPPVITIFLGFFLALP